MKKKILIVGGTGFLGYHVSKKCVQKGWKVTSISLNKPLKKRYLSNVRYIKLDITKKKQLKNKIKEKYNYVVNFAGYVNHYEKKKTFNSHYKGCKNLIDFFINKKIESFIQIGSCTEYGSLRSPQSEKIMSNSRNFRSTYGKAKYLATKYLIKKNIENNFPFTVLRLYLVYGPKQDYNRLIPVVIKNCIKKKTFPCSNGSQLRDFLYVDDFVKSVFKCLKSKDSKGQIFNIGYGKPIKVSEVINKINKTIGFGNPQFGKISLRADEINSLYPNIRKSAKILKWKPTTKFLTGIKKTIKYYKNSLKEDLN